MSNKLFILAVVITILGSFIQLLFGANSAINQLSFLLLSVAIYLLINRTDVRILFKLTGPLAALGVLLLTILLILVDPIRGAHRWFVIAGFNLQPSIVFMPFFLLFTALYVIKYPERKLADLLKIIFIIAFPVILVFKQPDLGTALVMIISLFSITYLSEFPIKYYLLLAVLMLPTSLAVFQYLEPYQRERLISYLNPGFDPSGINYNSLQSVIAIGSGHWFGKGFGLVSQSKLLFLPEAHTDFVFAALTEAFGLIGALLVIGLLFFFLFSLLGDVINSNNRVYRYYALGTLSFFFVQTVFNIGMNLRLLPVVGVPLPFISYGGSNILASFMLLAIASKLKSSNLVYNNEKTAN